MVARPLDYLDAKIARTIGNAERITEGFTRVTTVLPERLVAILDAHPAQPSAARYDSEPVNGLAMSDPTSSAALRAVTYGDRQAEDLRDLDRELDRAHRSLQRIVDLLVPYTPRTSTDYDRSLTSTNARSEPGCLSCARTEVAKGVTRWEPIHRANHCRWCYDFTLNTGQKPSIKQLEDHHAGRKVRRPA